MFSQTRSKIFRNCSNFPKNYSIPEEKTREKKNGRLKINKHANAIFLLRY